MSNRVRVFIFSCLGLTNWFHGTLSWWHCCFMKALRHGAELEALTKHTTESKHMLYRNVRVCVCACAGCCSRGETGLEGPQRRLHDGSHHEGLGQRQWQRGAWYALGRAGGGKWFRRTPSIQLNGLCTPGFDAFRDCGMQKPWPAENSSSPRRILHMSLSGIEYIAVPLLWSVCALNTKDRENLEIVLYWLYTQENIFIASHILIFVAEYIVQRRGRLVIKTVL